MFLDAMYIASDRKNQVEMCLVFGSWQQLPDETMMCPEAHPFIGRIKIMKKLYLLIVIILCVGLIFIPGSRAEQDAVEETGALEIIGPTDTLSAPQNALPISGTKTVGPAGDYASITAAIADIQAQGLDGALVLALLPTYTSAGETFPLNFTNLPGISATNTLKVVPQAGATNLAITGNSATAIINFDNVQFVTIDGRPAFTGTNRELRIENTGTGSTIRFINGASDNAVNYTVIRGANAATTTGVIFFGSTTGPNGNSNNTLDSNDIASGASPARNGVYSLGTTGTPSQNNSVNNVINNNFSNFYAATGDSAGVRLDAGNTLWVVSGNSVYQTIARPPANGTARGIYINNASGNGFSVTNNFIGGSAPNAGGAPWGSPGFGAPYRFIAIHLNAGTSAASSVQNNIIRNFNWNTSSNVAALPGVWSGVFVQNGSVSVTNNTIGGTGIGSVAVTTSGSGGTTYGIGSQSNLFVVNIQNNTVSSITVNGASNTVSSSLVGIQAGRGTITGNTVGSTIFTNSLNAATSSTSAVPQFVRGIVGGAGGIDAISNIIINLNNNYAGTATFGQIQAVLTTGGLNTINGNTIRNLSTTSANPGTGANASVIGISQNSTSGNQTVSQNTVTALSNTRTDGAVRVTGTFFTGTTVNLIERNLIRALSAASPDASLTGIHADGGTGTYRNNIVSLGTDVNGDSIISALDIIGIQETGGTNRFIHNSVHIGGVGVGPGARNTYGHQFQAAAGNISEDRFRNNIIINNRSNATTGGQHYAVQYPGTAFNPTVYANHNILFANGNGGVLGRFNNTDIPFMALWRLATGQDGSSAFVNPQFVNPNLGDLHLQLTNPATNAGDFTPVMTDFDGDPRPDPPIRPTIGADENPNFTPSGDFFPPSITTPILSNGSTASRVLTDFAAITDNFNVSGGANAPRIYYKKLTDANNFNVPNDSSGNGWKFVIASDTSSPFDFMINYSIINGGSVAVGDTIQWFVVAQDNANNLSSSPAGAGASSNPPVQFINAKPGGVYSYNIAPEIGGTRTVGPGGTYSALTTLNGAFDSINNSVLTSNLNVLITGDTTEDGTVSLNPIAQNNYPGTFTANFVPADGTVKTLSGNTAIATFRINGADVVTFDGSFSGLGQFLVFRNTNNAFPTLTIGGDANNLGLFNLTIEGANADPNSGVVTLFDGSNIGFDNVTFRDPSNMTGANPANLLAIQGNQNAPIANVVINNNDFLNYTGTAISGSYGDSWQITNDDINTSSNTDLVGVDLTNMSGTTVFDGNNVGLTTSGSAVGVSVGNSDPTVIGVWNINGNRIVIRNSGTSAATSIKYGLFSEGGATVSTTNNQITVTSSNGNDLIVGIYNFGSFGGVFNAFYNSVLLDGTVLSGSAPTWAYLKDANALTNDNLKNNILFNNHAGGGPNYAIGKRTNNGSFASDNNVFVGTGNPNPLNIFEDGTLGVSFADWRNNTGGDANSLAGNPGGQFVPTLFVDAATGNLQISNTTGYDPPPIVSDRGMPVAGTTTDFNGDTRSTTAPDVGSDEHDVNRTLSISGTLPAGNYTNITAGTGFSGGFGGGITVTLGGIVNVSGTMSVSCDSVLAGASPSHYVIGNLKKDFCMPGLFDYTVGTDTGYSPVSANITTLNTNPSSLTIKVANGTVSANPPINDAVTLDRFWSLTETGDLTADLLFNYLQADVDGDETMYRILKVTGGTPQYFANGTPCPGGGSPCIDTNANTMFIAGVTDFSNWSAGIPLAPTAAQVSVGGRVMNSAGRGLFGTRISIMGQNGFTRTVRSNQFGYYRFEGIAVGETYIVEARHKNHIFIPRVVAVSETLTDLDFTALP